MLVLPLAGLLAALASFAAEATSCAGVQSLLTATKQAFEREDLALAERTALKVHEKSPQCNEVLLWLGQVREAQGDVLSAQSLFSRYTVREPHDSKGYFYLARLIVAQQDYDRADLLTEEALSRKPDDPDVLALRGRILAAKGDNIRAQELLEKACKLAPNHVEAHFQLGRLFRQTERPLDAVVQFEKAIALEPRSPRVHEHLALTLEELGENEKAEAEYRKALQLNEGPLSDPFLDINYGRFLLKQNRLLESKQYLDRAAHQAPEARSTFYERARLDIRLKDYTQARRDAERALALPNLMGDVQDTQLFYLLVTIYTRTGEKELARKYSELCRVFSAPVKASPLPGNTR
ncbi:MAG: tetratricopeptide repeat protein [Terriglobia bacterium]